MRTTRDPVSFDPLRAARLAVYGLLAVVAGWAWALAPGAETNAAGPTGAPPRVVALTLEGAVTPANAGYLKREIETANAEGADLVLIEIDTPGGLVDAMKTVVKAIMASDAPVATYVAPQGARAASAGLYIMYAAHVSAMAPATNAGAATPVELGGSPGPEPEPTEPGPAKTAPPADDADAGDAEAGDGDAEPGSGGATGSADDAPADAADAPAPASNAAALRAKAINDSVAYIRALAEARGRNADWAERAVREAAAVTADEALRLGAIDLVAADREDLFAQIDGTTVETAAGATVVRARGATVVEVRPTLVERILGFIANPNVAAILFSLGTTGIVIEMWNPGSILPGTVGLLCLLMGLYAFQALPGNALFLGLMAVGALLVLIEAYTPTFGLSGLAGLAILATGTYFLFPEGFRVSPTVIGATVAIAGGFLAVVLIALVTSRSHGPLIGGEAIRRREGVVDEWTGLEGWVLIEGERWRARSDRPLEPGARIRVTDVDGLVLVVKAMKAGARPTPLPAGG